MQADLVQTCSVIADASRVKTCRVLRRPVIAGQVIQISARVVVDGRQAADACACKLQIVGPANLAQQRPGMAAGLLQMVAAVCGVLLQAVSKRPSSSVESGK